MELQKHYLRHDYHARNDKDIIPLIIKYGYEGYGLFWGIVEILYENGGYFPEDYVSLAYSMGIGDPSKIKDIVTNYDLFYINEDGNIASKSIDRRLEEIYDFKKKCSLAGKRSAEVRSAQRTLNPPSTKPQPVVEPIEKNRIKKNREEKNILKETTLVDWSNCSSDLQRFISWWVSVEQPEVFKSATIAQAEGIFKRNGAAASSILKSCGGLDLAVKSSQKARDYYHSKGLDFSINAIERNIDYYLNSVKMEEKK